MEKLYPHRCAGLLDLPLRRLFQSPYRIFKPYIESGMNVLDLGAGSGFTAIPFAEMVGDKGSVTAVDIQQEMLDILRVKAEKAGVSDRIVTHRNSGEIIGVTGTYDFANAFYMVHEVPSVEAFVREVFGVLKSGAIFFITEPVHHVTKNNFEKMAELSRKIGFVQKPGPRVVFSRTMILEKPGNG